jgi:hypothetical protein
MRGGDLPTQLVFSEGPNENNAKIYEYLRTLHDNNVDGNVILTIGVFENSIEILVENAVHWTPLLPSGILPNPFTGGTS